MISKLLLITGILMPNSITISNAIEEIPNINQAPRMITMSIANDSKTQMSFNYNTTWMTDTILQVNENNDFTANTVLEFEGSVEKSKVSGDGYIHRVTAKNLKADTTYYYRLGDKDADNWSDVATFTTANDSNDLKFIHISDPQGYEEIHYTNYNKLLKTALTLSNPDFVALTGDIVNDSYENTTPNLTQWEWALTDQKEFMQNIPFMTTAGNHDAADNDYASRFNHPYAKSQDTLKGGYYSFDYQGSHFISLNTNDTIKTLNSERGLSNGQINWLTEDLKAANKASFIIVMMHKGIYDAGGHCSNLEGEDGDIALIRDQLTPLFTKYGVDLVLQGHDHLYSRSYPLSGKMETELLTIADKEATKKQITFDDITFDAYENPNGAIYLNSGTASGSKYYGVVDYDSDKIPLEKTDSAMHKMFTEITIVDNTLYAKVYKHINGEAELFDTFSIIKTQKRQDISADNSGDSNVGLIIIICSIVIVLSAGAVVVIKKNKKKEVK